MLNWFRMRCQTLSTYPKNDYEGMCPLFLSCVILMGMPLHVLTCVALVTTMVNYGWDNYMSAKAQLLNVYLPSRYVSNKYPTFPCISTRFYYFIVIVLDESLSTCGSPPPYWMLCITTIFWLAIFEFITIALYMSLYS